MPNQNFYAHRPPSVHKGLNAPTWLHSVPPGKVAGISRLSLPPPLTSASYPCSWCQAAGGGWMESGDVGKDSGRGHSWSLQPRGLWHEMCPPSPHCWTACHTLTWVLLVLPHYNTENNWSTFDARTIFYVLEDRYHNLPHSSFLHKPNAFDLGYISLASYFLALLWHLSFHFAYIFNRAGCQNWKQSSSWPRIRSALLQQHPTADSVLPPLSPVLFSTSILSSASLP